MDFVLRPFRCVFFVLVAVAMAFPVEVGAMPLSPVTPGELRKAHERSLRPDLRPGRPVTEATTSLRERYWAIFERWANDEGHDLDAFFLDYNHHIDEVNCLMIQFGRRLYHSGKTYAQHAETLNALTSRKPGLKRMLTAAWDLGYAWNQQEPSHHHIPLPIPVLLAMISTSLMWGWLAMAGILSLGFGGLLRPGEIANALRRDLLTPVDTGNTTNFCLLTVREPKSRFTFARQQSSKIDSADLVEVIVMAFQDLEPHCRLWPYSAQTLRARFKALLQALRLPSSSSRTQRCLDLGSLRSGGATFIIMSTENGELCRRRGRWANAKMMEVYVQECMALQYMSLIAEADKKHIFALAGVFLPVLDRAKLFRASRVSEQLWYLLFSR